VFAVNCAGIIVCGGLSKRMGRPKASLPFGPETMLARVVRLLSTVVDPLVVVAAAGQELPQLPPSVIVARDRSGNRGPLEGLAVGLQALGPLAEAAFFTACDVPLLRPQFVSRMVELAADHDVTVPHINGHDEPLAAIYRQSVLPRAEALLAADRLRPVFLFDQVDTRRVLAEELLDVDPRLESLSNVNSPADYEAALSAARFST
jgi:molybdopterin-guanine dinucleotide biosynthesis protein A